MEELFKVLKENGELSAKLMKMWQEKASAADIAAFLKEEGHDVDISVVEEALQKAQKELAERVAMEKLDDEALAAVAGGDSDCDYQFKNCTTTMQNAECDYKYVCDAIAL